MKDYDVALIGGGLAGLTLALQLTRMLPDIRIAIFHRGFFPNKEGEHTVGEATVEIGGFYLREVLGLKEHLERDQLRTLGMRFMQNDGCIYREMGRSEFPLYDSYRIDRGRLENYIHHLIKEHVSIFEGHRFIDFSETNGRKELHFFAHGDRVTYRTDWLVDASGRGRVLARKWRKIRKSPLTNSAVWFRIDGIVDIECCEGYHHVHNQENTSSSANKSTVYFMGKGYCIWLIVLPSEKTSVGIVFDEKIYDFNVLSTKDKALKWLEKFEYPLFRLLVREEKRILNFTFYRKYSYGADMFLSHEKWAVTGEAKSFVDPLYSSGSDFIALENTMIAQTIWTDYQGKDISRTLEVYNNFIEFFYKVSVKEQAFKYQFFDDWYYVFVKTNIDIIIYYSSFCLLFMNGVLNNYILLEKCIEYIKEMYNDYDVVLEHLESFYLKNKDFSRRYINISSSIETKFRNVLLDVLNEENIIQRLKENAKLIHDIAQRLKKGEKFESIFYAVT